MNDHAQQITEYEADLNASRAREEILRSELADARDRAESLEASRDAFRRQVSEVCGRMGVIEAERDVLSELIASRERSCLIAEAELDEWRRRARELMARIRDIEEHATPVQTDADGFITAYALTPGALHRALGALSGASYEAVNEQARERNQARRVLNAEFTVEGKLVAPEPAEPEALCWNCGSRNLGGQPFSSGPYPEYHCKDCDDVNTCGPLHATLIIRGCGTHRPGAEMTYVKTYTLLHPWAETHPWPCLVRPTNCCSDTHNHSPMVDDPCAFHSCGKPLLENEVCYAVVELARGDDGHEQWVCWRHVRPNEGPLVVVPEDLRPAPPVQEKGKQR